MSKKIISVVLIVLFIMTLCSCGNKQSVADTDGTYQVYGMTNPVELGKPNSTINAKQIFENIEYTPEMFYGSYKLLGGDNAQKALPDEVGYYPDFTNQYGKQVSLLPFRFDCGRHTMNHMMCYIKQHNWIRLYFQTEAGSLDMIECAYELEGNKIKCYPLESFEYNKEIGSAKYALSDKCFEYEFEIGGLGITLSKNGKSVTLQTGLSVSDDTPYFHADCYLSKNSPKFLNISQITLHWTSEKKGSKYITLEYDDGTSNYGCAAEFTKDGLFTLTIPSEDNTTTYQLAYFYCGNDGLIFTDGINTYFYNQNYSDQYSNELLDNLSVEDLKNIESIEEETLQQIIEKKEDLFEDLTKAFKDVGISVKVDKENGEIAMDASVLFGGDSAVIRPEGKELLNKFLAVYTSIIYNDKYDGFISKTMIEGHTAPVSGSTYESGLPLSVERADNVKNYCLSADTGVDTAKLSVTLESVGQSNSKPIYDADGNYDMAACRRVSFRFIVNIAS